MAANNVTLPTIGRIVHYVLGEKHLPAIVVGYEDTLVNMTVFLDDPTKLEWVSEVEHNEEQKINGTWHWPERVQNG